MQAKDIRRAEALKLMGMDEIALQLDLVIEERQRECLDALAKTLPERQKKAEEMYKQARERSMRPLSR